MWTYKNDYYAVLIILFPTLKKKMQKQLKIARKSRDGSEKKAIN